jgi:hypothetical protein
LRPTYKNLNKLYKIHHGIDVRIFFIMSLINFSLVFITAGQKMKTTTIAKKGCWQSAAPVRKTAGVWGSCFRAIEREENN